MRAVLELRTYVEEMYGKEAEQQPPQEEPVEQEETIVACTICMEIVFFGEACPQQQCPVKLHRHCLRKYMQNRDTCLCPACRQPWNAPPNAANDADE